MPPKVDEAVQLTVAGIVCTLEAVVSHQVDLYYEPTGVRGRPGDTEKGWFWLQELKLMILCAKQGPIILLHSA